jgi:hypothetical protein
MNDWRFALWNPGSAPADDRPIFGGASHGFSTSGVWSEPQHAGVVFSPHHFSGDVVAGCFTDVLGQLRQLPAAPRAAIILFAGGTGAEDFLRQWSRLFPAVPVAGGAVARHPAQTLGELLPPAEDVAVLLLAGGPWRAETLNVHEVIGSAWQFQADGPRIITHLRRKAGQAWQTAAGVFRALQAGSGRESTDCESITWSDLTGRNLHCAFAGEYLHSGANLPADGRLLLRTVSPAAAAAKLGAFCAKPNTIVFGCAGLRSLLAAPIATGAATVAGFLFGEVVTVDGQPHFGNLMASRLVCG